MKAAMEVMIVEIGRARDGVTRVTVEAQGESLDLSFPDSIGMVFAKKLYSRAIVTLEVPE